MTEDTDIDLGELAGSVDLVLIGASDPEAMSSFTRQCREHKIPFAADTSWQLARMEGEQVRDLVDGAAYLFCNEYEATLTERKSGWSRRRGHGAGGSPGDHARRGRRPGGPGGRAADPGPADHRGAAAGSRPAPATRSGPGSWPRSPGGSAWSAPPSWAT